MRPAPAAVCCNVGNRGLRGPCLRIELRLVHRIGRLGDRRDVGNLPFLASITDGHGVGPRGLGTGAQRHAVGGTGIAVAANRNGVAALGRGRALDQALFQQLAAESDAGGAAADLHRLCRGGAAHAQSQYQAQRHCQQCGRGSCRIAALVDDPTAAAVGGGQFRSHHPLTQCFVPDLAINPIHRYGS
ncbi:hypothetical protein G6F68_012870 [Rhizopus microsporus]|nr:hypothetical protein G6F68_012870 [Rhizopus microsporus]